MKFTSVALSLAAAGTLAAAHPHRHHKHHHVRRAPEAEVETVQGPTVYYYEFEGETISEDKVCEGIADGSLEWADGTPPPSACNDNKSESDDAAPLKDAQFFEKPDNQNKLNVSPEKEEKEETTTSATYPTEVTSDSTPSASSTSGSDSDSDSNADGVDREFPDGKIGCDEFPSEYGPVAADWLDLGGWTGVQFVSVVDNMVSDIRTALTGQKCGNGAMCSYACPAGYQKTQWPETQGSTGQSVGGLECRNGKLYLTNKSFSNKLCMEGAGNVKVKNTMNEGVAVCRTDYPGTEAETVALDSKPGSTQPLTCPDSSKYYVWQGKPTTAQYYVNPAGVSVENGCQWGTPSKPWGNYAPINLGVGKTDGVTWLSIMQNAPTTDEKLDFNIKLKGDLGGACKYENGKFHDLNGSNEDGCTVQLNSGEATYEFY